MFWLTSHERPGSSSYWKYNCNGNPMPEQQETINTNPNANESVSVSDATDTADAMERFNDSVITSAAPESNAVAVAADASPNSSSRPTAPQERTDALATASANFQWPRNWYSVLELAQPDENAGRNFWHCPACHTQFDNIHLFEMHLKGNEACGVNNYTTMRWCCTGWCYLSHNDVTDNMARYLEPDHPNRPSAPSGDTTSLQEGINSATREREAPFIKSNFKAHERRKAYRARVSETMDVPLFVKIVDLPSTVDLG